MRLQINGLDVIGQTLTKAQAQGNLDIDFEQDEDFYYTLLVRDLSINPQYIHLLDINIYESQGQDYGDLILKYDFPNPPSGVHEYSVELYEQTGYIEPFEFTSRRLNLNSWIQRHNLTLVDQASFFVRA